MPPADPRGADPQDRDPRECGLQRRSGDAALSPWLIIFGLILLGAVVYVVSALL